MSKKMLFLGAFFVFTMQLFSQSPIQSVVKNTEGNYIFIQNDPSYKKGSSGIVIRDFGNSKAIIAKAIVEENDSKLAKLKLKEFTGLSQSALPDLNLSVENGDQVIMNYLYDRGLIIAPDKESLDLVRSLYKDVYFIDPDIFGAYLIRDSKIAPQRKHLEKFCSDNGVGVVAFVLKDRVKLVDCFELSVLDENVISQRTNEPQKPFYSRLTGYKQSLYGFFTEEIILDYYQFYEDLLSGKEAPDILDKIIGR